MNRSILTISLILPLTLAACGETRETLGIGRVSPDEYAVVDRPPLAIPPDYRLRPPQPGAPRPQAVGAAQRAEQAAYGAQMAGRATPKGALEQNILNNAGAEQVDPAIRGTLDKEAGEQVAASRRVVDDLLFWKKSTPPPATVVDPALELKRIEEAKKKNAAINSGPTPTIERRKSGLLGL